MIEAETCFLSAFDRRTPIIFKENFCKIAIRPAMTRVVNRFPILRLPEGSDPLGFGSGSLFWSR